MGTIKRLMAAAAGWAVVGTGLVAAAPAHAATVTPVVVRSTARYSSVVDSAGKTWTSRVGWKDVASTSTALLGKDVANTVDDMLYQYVGVGVGSYETAVPTPGFYRVRMLTVEPWFQAAGQRVFDVLAEGAPQIKGLDVFAAAGGKGIAYQTSFEAYVGDGQLTLAFPAAVNAAAVAALEVTGPVTDLATSIKLSPASFWTQPISDAPLAANSAALAASLNSQVKDYWNGVAAFNAYQYNTSFYRVPLGTPRITVGWTNCMNSTLQPYFLYNEAAHFVNVPVPDDAIPATGDDGELTLYDPSTDQVWEFWKMRRNPTTNAWEACWGGRLDNASTNQGVFPQFYGASASSLVAAAGMIGLDEVRRGEIRHAIYLALPDVADATRFSWPAQRSDGKSTAVDAIHEGQRLRLDPAVNVDALNLTPIGKMVAKAAQRYGFVVADVSGGVAVQTESGVYEKARTGKDPWDALLGGPTYSVLANFPWDQTQFLPVDYGKPATPSPSPTPSDSTSPTAIPSSPVSPSGTSSPAGPTSPASPSPTATSAPAPTTTSPPASSGVAPAQLRRQESGDR